MLLISLSALFFAACNSSDSSSSTTGAEAKPAFDLAAAKAAIDARNAEFATAVGKMDSVSLSNLYTADGKLLAPNMPEASGTAAIKSTFGGMFSAMGKMGLKLTAIEVWGNESVLTEEGVYTMSDKDGKEVDKGKYLVVWKMDDGKWKLHRDIWNSDNPPMPAAK